MKLTAVSRPMRDLLRQARRYAAVDATVLITGETGVGKDALARFLHSSGPRRRDPFVAVDCPALPETLVESELFGHERGAFTDATIARPGRFELAGHGTVYLDGVTRLSEAGQGALLRVVEERQVTRLGGTTTTEMKARIIASSDTDMEEAVRGGALRADLFHRLSVLPLKLPPLRDRTEDILPLAKRFLADASERLNRQPPRIAADAEDALVRYHWPGNIRELRHILDRVLLAGVGAELDAKSLPIEILEGSEAYLAPGVSRRPTLEDVERRYIELTLVHARGNQTRAAAILGISRKALWEKRKRFGLR
jgi:two-component system, NtrC family, response regulator HydG